MRGGVQLVAGGLTRVLVEVEVMREGRLPPIFAQEIHNDFCYFVSRLKHRLEWLRRGRCAHLQLTSDILKPPFNTRFGVCSKFSNTRTYINVNLLSLNFVSSQ